MLTPSYLRQTARVSHLWDKNPPDVYIHMLLYTLPGVLLCRSSFFFLVFNVSTESHLPSSGWYFILTCCCCPISSILFSKQQLYSVGFWRLVVWLLLILRSSVCFCYSLNAIICVQVVGPLLYLCGFSNHSSCLLFEVGYDYCDVTRCFPMLHQILCYFYYSYLVFMFHFLAFIDVFLVMNWAWLTFVFGMGKMLLIYLWAVNNVSSVVFLFCRCYFHLR